MKFQIQITEMLQRLVEVDAESTEEAETIVRKQYRSELIVLDSSDFVRADFEIIEARKEGCS